MSLLKSSLLFFLLICFTAVGQVKNPRTLPNEWEIYGVGDPYILKYKGKYWLYASTRDDLTGVKVWSSWNLANWNYEGLCATDPVTKGAYAPEVIYYNGMFYMYTSPGGRGHFILSSQSPTGPFVPETGNIGLSIDANVFIDDDWSLYFTYAGFPNILGKKMNNPLVVDGPTTNTQATLNEWTEGSTIFKRNGLYYMTYTGNHVISRGYRVAYGTSTSPLGPYTASGQGPLVLNTEGGFYGLGHSGTVQGPDLDTWYIAYHNKYGDQGKGPIRALNIDPHGFNGDKMVVYGPCNWTQPTPNLPTFYDRFDRNVVGSNWQNVNGGNWGVFGQELMFQDQTGNNTWYRQVSSQSTADEFIAEFNMKEFGRGGDNARFGAVFAYQNEDNYARAVFSSFNNTLEVSFIQGGSVVAEEIVGLLGGWDYQKSHALRVEKKENEFKVFVDGTLQITEEVAGFSGGKIGLTTMNDHADFGYTAFSNHINGSGIFDFHKPVPGTIEAVHYNSGGEGVGYHDVSSGNEGGAYRKDNVDIRTNPEGGFNIGWNSTGEWYNYNINVRNAGNYHLGIRYATAMEGTKVRFKCDGDYITDVINLQTTGGWDNWQTHIINDINLPTGYHTFTVETIQGEFDFYSLDFDAAANFYATPDNFNAGFSGAWNYADGGWNTNGGTANLNGWGKRAIGNTGWSNYAVEADIRCPAGGNSGLIFRVQNPANGLADNDSRLGTDFYQGYYVGIQTSGIQLGKQNYNWEGLAFNAQAMNANQWYKVRVVGVGPIIKVFVNDMNTPVIEFFDTKPILSGKAGLRVFDADASFDNFQTMGVDCFGTPGGTAYQDVCGACVGGLSGNSTADADQDGVPDCNDLCPIDAEKTEPGLCGCGNVDTDAGNDGICDLQDDDMDNDGIPQEEDCDDNNPEITTANTWYLDADNDGVGTEGDQVTSCIQPEYYVTIFGDECPDDMNKTTPGNCGCGNTEERCLDCAGVPNGTAEYDDCGVCDGENACVDCAGTPNGDAYYDNCETCVEGSTGLTPCTQDCSGEWGGEAFEDACEICAGGNTGIEPQEECIATNLYIEDVGALKIYPNPFSGVLFLETEEGASFELYNAKGILIQKEDEVSNPLYLEHLPVGTYLIRVFLEGESYSQLIIKQ